MGSEKSVENLIFGLPIIPQSALLDKGHRAYGAGLSHSIPSHPHTFSALSPPSQEQGERAAWPASTLSLLSLLQPASLSDERKPARESGESQKRLPPIGLLIGMPGAIPGIPCMPGMPGILPCIGPTIRLLAQYGQKVQRSSSKRSHLGQGRLSFWPQDGQTWKSASTRAWQLLQVWRSVISASRDSSSSWRS